MPDSPENPRQVNVRLEFPTYERLVAWGYLETGEATPGKFTRDLLTGLIDAAAEDNSEIDRLVRLRAERRVDGAEQ